MNERNLGPFAVVGVGLLAVLLIAGLSPAYAGQLENAAKSHTISTVSSTIASKLRPLWCWHFALVIW